MLKILSEELVRRVVNRSVAYKAAELAFRASVSGKVSLLPVVLGDGFEEGSNFAIKSAVSSEGRLIGLKVGSYWPENTRRNLVNHGSTILLLDSETGFPKVLVNAGYLNGLRTAAADAVGTNFLANEDARILGVIGAGHQAEFDVRAILDIRPIELVKVWSRSEKTVRSLCDRLSDLDVEVIASSCEATVRGSHIITTVTTACMPIVQSDWVEPGTHISAMGADKQGKQELSPDLFGKATCFADFPEQSRRIGEFQHRFPAGTKDSKDDIVAIGDVITGEHSGRKNSQEITIFDSSGIALQDLFIADSVFNLAVETGDIIEVEF